MTSARDSEAKTQRESSYQEEEEEERETTLERERERKRERDDHDEGKRKERVSLLDQEGKEMCSLNRQFEDNIRSETDGEKERREEEFSFLGIRLWISHFGKRREEKRKKKRREKKEERKREKKREREVLPCECQKSERERRCPEVRCGGNKKRESGGDVCVWQSSK